MSEQFESSEQGADVEGHIRARRDESAPSPAASETMSRGEEDVEGHIRAKRDETSTEDEGPEVEGHIRAKRDETSAEDEDSDVEGLIR